MKLLSSLFCFVYSRVKLFVFAKSRRRHFCGLYLRIRRKEPKIRSCLCCLPSAVNVVLNLSNLSCFFIVAADSYKVHYQDLLFKSAFSYIFGSLCWCVDVTYLIKEKTYYIFKILINTDSSLQNSPEFNKSMDFSWVKSSARIPSLP